MQTKLGAITVSIGLGAGIAACSTARGQIPEGWEIVEIFPAGTEYYCGPPDINDRGQIVFHRSMWPPVRTAIEILLCDHGKLVQITNDTQYDAFPRINNHGHIVWQRDVDPDPEVESVGIVRWRNGQLEVVSDEPYFEGSADINDMGQIVWSGLTDPTGGTDGEIFFFDGAKIIRLGDNRFLNDTPRINGQGDLVFTQYDFRVDPWLSEVFAYLRRFLSRLSTGQPQVQRPDLNDRQQVVWAGYLSGLELWESSVTETILLDSYVYGPRINNRGDICTSRWDTLNRNPGLWLKRKGTPFAQLTDGSFGGNLPAMNDRGEIAFEHGRPPYPGIALFTKSSFRADVDFDGDVDLRDAAVFQSCFRLLGSGIDEACLSSDINNNGVVDSDDFASVAKFLGGPE